MGGGREEGRLMAEQVGRILFVIYFRRSSGCIGAVVPRGAGGCEGCEMEFVVEVDGLVISGRGRVFCIRFLRGVGGLGCLTCFSACKVPSRRVCWEKTRGKVDPL